MPVIFDLDGVIVDNNAFHRDAWIEVARSHGFNLTVDDFKQHVSGRSNPDAIAYLFGSEIGKELVEKVAEEKEVTFRRMSREHIVPMKGLMGFLDLLRQNKIPCAIGTSAPAENVKIIMDKLKLRDYFRAIVDATQFTRGKPDPEIYLKTAARIGAEPEQCIVFEDSLAGIMAAKAAGMSVIAITTTHPREELGSADYVIDDFTQVEISLLNSLVPNL